MRRKQDQLRKEQMKATVVIPNYNGIRYLADCLDTLSTQSTEDYSVLVVDNGSTDGSFELAADYPQVRTIRFEENRGFCEAVNAGIKAAESEYVILLNNDTQVKPCFVEKLIRAIEQDPKIFSVSAKMLSMTQPEKMDDAGDLYCALGWAYARGKGRPAEEYSVPCKIFFACAGAAIYRKKVFEEIGYFDPMHFAYLEDLDIGYRARIYGYSNRYEPEAEVLHAGSGSSGSRYNEFKVSHSSANSIYVIAKNMPLLQILINLPFLLAGFVIKILFFICKGLGITYIKGLGCGIAMSVSKEGRKKKVRFRMKHFGNYVLIQLQLWWNIVLRLLG